MQWVPVYEFVILREPAPGAGHATLRVHLPEEGAVEELQSFLGERSIDGTALLTATAEACDRAGWLPWLIVIGDPSWRIDTMAAATAAPAADVLAFPLANLLIDGGGKAHEPRTQGVVIAIRSRSAARRAGRA